MIDDVDVAECKYIYTTYLPIGNVKIKCGLHQGIGKTCNDYPNCHYKLYKSKEQECEFWKKELDKTHLLMLKRQDELVKEILKNDLLKAENEELEKWKKEHLKDVDFIERNPVIDILNSMAKNILLEQQNEKLKRALQDIKDYCNKYPQNSIGFKQQILQKCEVLND